MIFKNITKKNIYILYNGSKIIIKPNEYIDGDKDIFKNYKGLLKINNPKVKEPAPPVDDYGISEIIIEDLDPQSVISSRDIVVDFIVIEDI